MSKKDKGPLAAMMMELAWGIRGGRFRAKKLSNSLVLPTHRVDPDDVMDYHTSMTMSRLTRRDDGSRRRAGQMIPHLHGGVPVKRLLEILTGIGGDT